MKNISIEDYLRTIYDLYENENDKTKGMKSIDVAKGLKISKPSVSGMLKKLAKEGFIKAKPYSNIFFTVKGLRGARRGLRMQNKMENMNGTLTEVERRLVFQV